MLRALSPRQVLRPGAARRIVPAAWRSALLASMPPLLASLLFALRLAGQPWLDGNTLALAGMLLVAACLAAVRLAPWLDPLGRLGYLTMAVSLGLVVPTFAIHVLLAYRALVDPVIIVLIPALISLALFGFGLLSALALALVQRPHPAHLAVALLPAAALTIWSVPLLWRPEEMLIWGVLAFTFALTALAWFAAGLIQGWPTAVPTAVALTITWAAALTTPRLVVPTGRLAGLLPAGHLALAVAATILPLLAPLAIQLWRRQRR